MNLLKLSGFLAAVAAGAGIYWWYLGGRLDDFRFVDTALPSVLRDMATQKTVAGWSFIACGLASIGAYISRNPDRD